MSDTPRTDKLARPQFDQGQDGDDVPYVVDADFARELERELAEARALLDDAYESTVNSSEYPDSPNMDRELRARIKKHLTAANAAKGVT